MIVNLYILWLRNQYKQIRYIISMYTKAVANKIYSKLENKGVYLYKINDENISNSRIESLDKNKKYKCLSIKMGDEIPKLNIDGHKISIDEVILKLEKEYIEVYHEPRDEEKGIPLSFILGYDKFLDLIEGLNERDN